MQRKPSFPVANCNIKMPDPANMFEQQPDDEAEHQQKRQQLINFGHSQWGFNNWSWSVNKQELDFVDFSNGKHTAGVVSYVSVTLKSFDIHRENIGYATATAPGKGLAIYKARKTAVTNALRETLLSFGGSVSSELLEILESHKNDVNSAAPAPSEPQPENNQNAANQSKPAEPKNAPLNRGPRKEEGIVANARSPLVTVPVKNVPSAPVAKAHPMPANVPAAANRPPLAAATPRLAAPAAPAAARPNSNVSYVLQPVVGAVPPLFPPRLAPPPPPPPPHPPQLYPNTYYEYSGPWHFAYETYDRPPGNVNLNFAAPPKNLVVTGRGPLDCRATFPRGAEGEPPHYAGPPPPQGCWIKPTIFYDGFWTEQKVKKWVAEQVEKQYPEDTSQKPGSPNGAAAMSAAAANLAAEQAAN